MSTARKAALRRILIQEGINPEALKNALEMDINTYIGSLAYYRDERKEFNTPIDEMEWVENRNLETYFLLRQALD